MGQAENNLCTRLGSDNLSMKIRILTSLTCLLSLNYLSIGQISAADFSKAQQTYVPPSYIRRDLDALGTNNWTFPGLSTNAATNVSSSPANFKSRLNGVLGSGAASPEQTALTGGVDASGSAVNWDKVKDVASHYKYIPGISTQVDKIQSKVSNLLQTGKYGDAENIARAGLKYFPTSGILKTQFASATAAEAQAYLLTKNYDSAGKKARETLVADPNNKKAKVVIGKVLQAQGLDPNSAATHVSVADGLAADGRLLEASVEYKTALNIKPSAPAHVGLGNLAIGKGQITEAHRHFEQALNIDPNSALAYRQRGALRYVMRDTVGANSDFSKAVSLAPDDQLASNALVGLWKQEVANDPNAVNGHLGLARAYMQTNNLEAARAEYKTVVSIDPNHPSLPSARASFKTALSKQEANKCVQAAKTLDSQGAYAEAHQKLIEAAGYSPDDSQIHLYHGQVLEKMGLHDQAHDAYMSALKTDPKNVEAAKRVNYLNGKNSAALKPTIINPTGNAQPAIGVPVASPLPSTIPAEAVPPIAPPRDTVPTNVEPFPGSPNLADPSVASPVPNSLPDSNLQNVPLKSPLDPKASNQSFILPENTSSYAYYPVAQSFYCSDPAHISMLSNFASCLHALMLSQKQALQKSNAGQYNNSSSINLSSAYPGYSY